MNYKTILIATGIYPPEIGGPATYAKGVEDTFVAQGKEVLVATFGFERKLPTGFRHIYFLLKNLPKFVRADFILVLDTWSVAIPTAVACLLLRKSFVIRTGGDFLWESYVERTKKRVLLRNFYKTEMSYFNIKEKIIFKATKWVLHRARKVIFSTSWQRDIWKLPYCIDVSKTQIVENFVNIVSREGVHRDMTKKIFVASTRDTVWKNKDMLKKVFEDTKKQNPDIELFTDILPNKEFKEKIKHSYAVILVSLGDISPNMILDAISLGTPFICTKECGFFDAFKKVGVWVDPLDQLSISNGILYLLDEGNYQRECQKLNTFTHKMSWEDIVKEIFV